ncbi:MAG: SPOR domain-containing protein [Gammaproteobacteria bacterium]|nr:SPOR domain-containing protein [Gammaproteobacteria bacterium]
MDRALKQRLLGAVILAALLVILVPEWLDGSGHKSRYPQHIDIPQEPEFKPMTELMGQPESAEATDLSRNNIAADKPVTKTPDASIHAWALQVGSFSEQANAQVLRDKLRAKGHPAYVDVQKSPGRKSYRVRIGPELDRSRVDKLKQEILASEKLKGIVVNHP